MDKRLCNVRFLTIIGGKKWLTKRHYFQVHRSLSAIFLQQQGVNNASKLTTRPDPSSCSPSQSCRQPPQVRLKSSKAAIRPVLAKYTTDLVIDNQWLDVIDLTYKSTQTGSLRLWPPWRSEWWPSEEMWQNCKNLSPMKSLSLEWTPTTSGLRHIHCIRMYTTRAEMHWVIHPRWQRDFPKPEKFTKAIKINLKNPWDFLRVSGWKPMASGNLSGVRRDFSIPHLCMCPPFSHH